jgi:hypothetical protein
MLSIKLPLLNALTLNFRSTHIRLLIISPCPQITSNRPVNKEQSFNDFRLSPTKREYHRLQDPTPQFLENLPPVGFPP